MTLFAQVEIRVEKIQGRDLVANAGGIVSRELQDGAVCVLDKAN